MSYGTVNSYNTPAAWIIHLENSQDRKLGLLPFPMVLSWNKIFFLEKTEKELETVL